MARTQKLFSNTSHHCRGGEGSLSQEKGSLLDQRSGGGSIGHVVGFRENRLSLSCTLCH